MPDQQRLSLPTEYMITQKQVSKFLSWKWLMFLLESNKHVFKGFSFHFTWSNEVSLLCLLIISKSIFMASLINICAVKIKLLARSETSISRCFIHLRLGGVSVVAKAFLPLLCWLTHDPEVPPPLGGEVGQTLFYPSSMQVNWAVWLPFTGWVMITIHFIFLPSKCAFVILGL